MRLVIQSRASGLPERYLGFSTILENATAELVEESDNELTFDIRLLGKGEEHLAVDMLTFNFKPASDGISKVRVSVRGRREIQNKSLVSPSLS